MHRVRLLQLILWTVWPAVAKAAVCSLVYGNPTAADCAVLTAKLYFGWPDAENFLSGDRLQGDMDRIWISNGATRRPPSGVSWRLWSAGRVQLSLEAELSIQVEQPMFLLQR